MKAERVKAAERYQKQIPKVTIDRSSFVASLKQAYQVTRIINHEIGFNLMREVSEQLNWELNFSEIARIWTNGCIIRSELMEELVAIYQQEPRLLVAPTLVDKIRNAQQSFAAVVALGLQYGVPLPVLSSGLNYLLGYSTADSSANLIQAQRDYFGAHTYQRKDKPAGEYFHTEWKSIG
ncbi:6-phosphogluconate dehydrogenase [Pontibacter sp. BAB1700]|nr:6-phosphogluconate dehydrogenase [Pontibacter sp. BAB1700]